MTLWKGRFKGPMSHAMARIGQSLSTDLRLFPYEIEVDRVYALALEKIGILDSDGVSGIHDALDEMQKEFDAGEYTSDKFPDEDVHSLIERRLTAKAGPAGAKIHTGRSRNDLILTDVHLYLKDQCSLIKQLLGELGRALLKQADGHMDTIMPGYTHLRSAQPVSLAHYIYSFCFYIVDDIKRIDRLMEGQMNLLPLGAGAIAGSAFPIDREWMARKLGFAGVTENSMQTISSRDEFLEAAGALSIIMIHLSRYAEDFIIWSTQEFGFMELDDSMSTGSSMMPQKKNPDSLELIRGKAARVIGQQQTLFTLQKGLPLTYVRDLQEDKPALFDMLEQTEVSLEVFAKVISTATFNVERMAGDLSVELMATDLADYLVKKGMAFREAYEVVAKIFKCMPAGAQLTIDDLSSASPLFDSDAIELLDPGESVKLREVTGGTGPESVKKQRRILTRYFS